MLLQFINDGRLIFYQSSFDLLSKVLEGYPGFVYLCVFINNLLLAFWFGLLAIDLLHSFLEGCTFTTKRFLKACSSLDYT